MSGALNMDSGYAGPSFGQGRFVQQPDGSILDTQSGQTYASAKDIPGQLGSGLSGMFRGQGALGNNAPMDVPRWLSNVFSGQGALGGAPAPDAPPLPPRPAAAGPAPAGGPSTAYPSDSSGAVPLPLPPTPAGAGPADAGAGGFFPALFGFQRPGGGGKGGAAAAPLIPASLPPPIMTGGSGGDAMSKGASALGDALTKNAAAPVSPTGNNDNAADSPMASQPVKSEIANAVEEQTAAPGPAPAGPDYNPGALGGILPQATIDASLRAHAYQPPKIDVTSGLADKAGALGPVTRRGLFGPTTSGSFMSELTDNPGALALMRFGLGTMANAGQPWASTGGSIGAGGLGALSGFERDTDTAEAKKWRESGRQFETNKYLIDLMGKNQDRQDKLGEFLITSGQKNQELSQGAAKVGIEARNSANTGAYQQGQLANTRSANANTATSNALRAAQDKVIAEHYSNQDLAAEDARWEALYNANLNSDKNDVSTITPEGAQASRSKAREAASNAYPNSRAGRDFAQEKLQTVVTAVANAQATKNPTLIAEADARLQAVLRTYYRGLTVEQVKAQLKR